MSAIQQYLHDRFVYASAYLSGRLYALPRGPSDLYALLVSKTLSIIALPLPLLSFLIVPFYGGSSTTASLLVFYLTWSALVLSHDPLTIEIYGTIAVRGICFVLPALVFLAFDLLLPQISKNVKARGTTQLPGQLGRRRLIEIVTVAVGNVALSILAQAMLELLVTRVLRLRSIIKVTSVLPLPWTVVSDLLKGLAGRGIVGYLIHRYLLHTYNTPLKTWHLQWQHSIRLPFSFIAAYDHPIAYLVRAWIPALLPAYLFRFHVLTWHLFLLIISLEELFTHSGYAVLPSSILLAGMARRTDAHFDSVRGSSATGNFGTLGALDFAFGTTCKEEDDILDDIRTEADKHRLQDRIDAAVQAALSKEHSGAKSSKENKVKRRDVQEKTEDTADGNASESAPRRSGRRRLFKS